MSGSLTIRFVCIAGLLAAAFLPTADQRFTSRPDTEHKGAASVMSGDFSLSSAVCTPLRNQRQDLRDLRPALALPTFAGLHGNFNGGIFTLPAFDIKSALIPADASLLSLHCLLAV